mmetsp:Transcript_98405/g.195128  ORF Transcript_98405/g.195128 Transcript_98405/m.195128 type:complete len:593 (-) Transcript_98405:104-1882(-)
MVIAMRSLLELLILSVFVGLASPKKCSDSGENCEDSTCCVSPLMQCYRKNEGWASCKSSCLPGIDYTDPKKFQTPWSCDILGGSSESGNLVVMSLPDIPTGLPTGVLPALAAPQCQMGVTQGAIGVAGVYGNAYAAGNGGRVTPRGLLLGHNSGYSIMSACRERFDADSFAVFKLIGRKFSYTVDISRVGCACNLAVYLIAQPARGRNGYPNPGPQGDYYCDANKVQGQWCPEIDIMEANRHVFAATPHMCDTPNSRGHYSNCDRSGMGQNTRDKPGVYGYGSEFTINTYKPFIVTTEFVTEDGYHLSGMRTVLSQEDREVELGHSNTDSTYLGHLSKVLADGMTMRITYWGKKAKTMSWLDMPPCERVRCEGDRAGVTAISNLAVQGTPFSIVTDKSTLTTTPAWMTLEPGTETPEDDDVYAQQGPYNSGPYYSTAPPGAQSSQGPFSILSIQSGVALAIALISAAALTFACCPGLFRKSSHGVDQRGAYGAQGPGGMQDVQWAHPSPLQHQGPFGGYGHTTQFAAGQAGGPMSSMGPLHPGQLAMQGQFPTQGQGFQAPQPGGFETACFPQYAGTSMSPGPYASMASGPL